jgi:nucleoside phosphorylase
MAGKVTIGIVTAVPIEHAALREVLVDPHDHQEAGDPKWYCVGTVPSSVPGVPHRVATTLQTRDGTRDAAASVTNLIRSFPSLRSILMCGIAAGVPAGGVGLGDIVSATEGIVDYAHLRATDEGLALRRAPGDISASFLDADHRLAQLEIRGSRPWTTVLAALERDNAAFRRPPVPGEPAVHRGAFGSSDVLLRDAKLRDGLARRHRVIAFEMEASGVAAAARLHEREWFLVKGVSDLADRNKDDRWHGYAAAASAAYVRALLGVMTPETTRAGAGRPGRTANLSRILDALLDIRAIHAEHDRQRLIDELPPYLRSSIAYSPTTRTHFLSILRACQDNPEGRDALLAALGMLLGTESPAFEKVGEIIRENWTA